MKGFIKAILGTLLCSGIIFGASSVVNEIPINDNSDSSFTQTVQHVSAQPKELANDYVEYSGTKRIKDTLIINKDSIIPDGAVFYVKKGGAVYINEGVTLVVKGKLKCANGGSIYARGRIESEENSVLSLSGKLKLLSSGSLALSGKLKINENGVVKGNGTLEVCKLFSDITCTGDCTAKIKAPAPATENGVTTVGGVILVNKEYSLPEDYGSGLDQKTYSAYLKMKEESGYDMSIVSGFRSYETQQEVFDYWVSIDGYEKARTYSALAGQSEHQTGLAMDISSLSTDYEDTAEGKWLAENCWKYGFIIRYPKGKTKITGYIYEPWHVRYLGKSTAKLVKDSGLTLEEFLGVYP